MQIGKKSASTGFDIAGIREFAIMCQNNELAAFISALSFDESFNSTAIIALEDCTNLKLIGSGAISAVTGDGANYTKPIIDPHHASQAVYVIYKAANNPSTLRITCSSAKDIVYGAIA